MERGKTPEAIHTWLIMLKVLQAIRHFALPPILKEGLGESDFRVLKFYCTKGRCPLTPLARR